MFIFFLADNDSPPEFTDDEGPLRPKKNDKLSGIEYHESLGWPLIPSRGRKPLRELKALIRAYVTATYRKPSYHTISSYIKHLIGHFTHNDSALVPWRSLSQDSNHEYIGSDSLPDGILLLDPSKLRRGDITMIWHQWEKRQCKGIQGLVFLHAVAGDMRPSSHNPHMQKKKDVVIPYHEPSDMDIEEDDDEEGEADGTSQTPHPESPAANAMSLDSQMAFLKALSTDIVYNDFVDLLYSREPVSALFNDR